LSAWLPARITQRKVNENEARDPGLLDDVSGAPDDHRCDSCCLEATGDQTHGLVAHRSKWNEQRDVDAILFTPLGDLIGVEPGPTLAVLGGHTEKSAVK